MVYYKKRSASLEEKMCVGAEEMRMGSKLRKSPIV